jgi:hypothetical protein
MLHGRKGCDSSADGIFGDHHPGHCGFLPMVECVVGRVNRGNEWGIVDRSGDFSRTVFVNPEVEIE